MGLRDEWPVTCEPFCQWVIEDNFSNGRPAWEKVGAQFVADVTPYEKMKLRLLNAGHSVLGILGSIHGHETIDECVSDELFATYLRKFMDAEATPVLDAVEGIDLDAYKDTLIERFGNPNIKDSLARICLESSSKLPVFLIPTIRENLERGGSVEFAALVIAAWCLYSDKGVDQFGKKLEIVDEMKEALHQAAKGTRNEKLAFLKLTPVFGDLVENERFTGVYSEMIDRLYENPDVSVPMRTILSKNRVRRAGDRHSALLRIHTPNMTVECHAFGEILWDCLPSGRHAGGAPFNVTAHLVQLGASASLLSAIGDDELGAEILQVAKDKGVNTEFIGRHPKLPTGTVLATVDAKGNATYDIVEPVAWDEIEVSAEALEAVAKARAFIFGSLSCRSPHNVRQLRALLDLSGPLKFFDVNLRPPYADPECIIKLAKRADVLKLNHEEVGKLAAWIQTGEMKSEPPLVLKPSVAPPPSSPKRQTRRESA